MTERQLYYRDLLQSLIEQFYDVEIDPTTDAEAPLPNVRIDLLFDLPKDALVKALETPFPYLTEVNLVHIKALYDNLTKKDVVQYLGESYVLYASSRADDKTISLTIISAKNVGKSIRESLYSPIVKTEYEWIEKIEAEVPAYLFTLDKLPQEHKYFLTFLPFMSLGKIKEHKEKLHKVLPLAQKRKEVAYLFFWLRKLQPEFYLEEFDMKLDMETVVEELCPKTLAKAKKERDIEIATNLLKLGQETALIVKSTGLSEAEVEELRKKLSS